MVLSRSTNITTTTGVEQLQLLTSIPLSLSEFPQSVLQDPLLPVLTGTGPTIGPTTTTAPKSNSNHTNPPDNTFTCTLYVMATSHLVDIQQAPSKAQATTGPLPIRVIHFQSISQAPQ